MVRSAATQLYAGAPAEFIASRTALVKQAKAEGKKEMAKEIAALRKPSVAAWVLNQVVHRHHQVISTLADVGTRLRHATASLDAAGIADMRQERDAVLRDLVSAAEEIGAESGHPISAAVLAEVRDTGIASLADEAAQQVLESGTLTRALSYSGFGEVDLSQAAATTSTGVVLTSISGGRRAEGTQPDDTEPDDTEPDNIEPDAHAEDDAASALSEAAAAAERDRRLAQAETAVATAEKEVGRRRSAVDAARNRTEATRQRIHKLEAQLEQARLDDEDALGQLTEAVAAAKQAATDLDQAREHLAWLRSGQHSAPDRMSP